MIVIQRRSQWSEKCSVRSQWDGSVTVGSGWLELRSMQPNLFPFGSALSNNPFILNEGGGGGEGGIDSSRVLVLLPFFLLSQGGAMDLSKVGEKIFSSVKSARSLGLLPSLPDRPEVIQLIL